MQIIPSIIPYEEDELFYSWLCRLAVHNYATNLNEFANNYVYNGKFTDTRHIRRVRYDFTENLYYFQRAIKVSDKQFQKIFYNTSIFCAISPFMNDFNKRLYYNLAIENIGKNEEKILLQTLSNVIDNIQICPECMEEDKKEKDFFWYRRAHQLPGVKVCHKHHCSLKVFVGLQGNEFNDVYYSHSEKTVHHIDVEYAIFCKKFLDREIETNIYELKKIILERCKELGFEQQKYKTLNEKIQISKYKKLFSQQASLFVERVEVDGTYIDPVLGLSLLFYLFKDIDVVQKRLANEHKLNIVSKNSFEGQLKLIIQASQLKMEDSKKNLSPTETMQKEIYSFVGDEYELVGDYSDRVTKVQFKHKSCQKTFIMKPMNFLDGGRCPFCKVVIKEDLFKQLVPNLSNNRYIVRGRATRNLWIIHDTLSKKDILLTKQKTMQELNKNEASYVLPFQQKSKRNVQIITRDREVYNWIRKEYAANSIIFFEDIKIPGYTYDELKDRMRRLRQAGDIEMISPGIYNFPGADFSHKDLLINHYLIRKGEHIGFYYGQTLGQELGLCGDTERLYIASNKEAQRHGRKKEVYGTKIRLKGTVTEVKEENYRILAILDFITCYKTYTR